MTEASDKQIKALIRLLWDDDERVVKTISAKLVEVGPAAVPLLQEAEIEQPEVAARIAAVVDDIRGASVEQQLLFLIDGESGDLELESGAFLLARYAYPNLDEAFYRAKLDEMAQEALRRIDPRADEAASVRALGSYLFTELEFRGNAKDYYDAENSYVNRVLDRRTGIPISLSIVYLLVARRLGWPVFGIGMPGHFLVQYDSERFRVFVDCFNAGAFLTERDCARFLIQAGYGFDEQYLTKSSNRAILIRSLRNLIPIYQKLDDRLRATRLSRFVQILECPNAQAGF